MLLLLGVMDYAQRVGGLHQPQCQGPTQQEHESLKELQFEVWLATAAVMDD